MDTVMHIMAGIGVVSLVAIAAVAIVIAVVIFKVKKAFKGLKEWARSQTSTPARITVTEALESQWKKAAEMQSNKDTALRLGFTDLGPFEVEEMPGVLLNALVKVPESSYCIIYEHPVAGMWIDMVTKYDDDTGLTVGNAPRGGELDVRPGQKKVNAKELDLEGLYSRLVQERESKPLRPLTGTKEEFVTIFERAYADEMDWRNARGGATEDEIRRVGALSGKDYSDDVIKQTEAVKNRQACEGLIVAFEEVLRETHTDLVADWDGIRHRLIFIHDRLPLDAVQELAATHIPHAAFPNTLPAGTSVRETFHRLNHQAPKESRLKPLTVLDRPVETDVYLVPERKKAAV